MYMKNNTNRISRWVGWEYIHQNRWDHRNIVQLKYQPIILYNLWKAIDLGTWFLLYLFSYLSLFIAHFLCFEGIKVHKFIKYVSNTAFFILFDCLGLFGMNMLNLSPHSSLHLSCRTLHSSLQHWIQSLVYDLPKIHNPLPLFDAPYILNLDCEYLRISLLYHYQKLDLFLFKYSLTNLLHFSRDQTITNHTVVLNQEFKLVLGYLWSVECLWGQDLILHAYKWFSNRLELLQA